MSATPEIPLIAAAQLAAIHIRHQVHEGVLHNA
jgi:hypothetical protein